jgi:lipopolysaccharide export system protein LptA
MSRLYPTHSFSRAVRVSVLAAGLALSPLPTVRAADAPKLSGELQKTTVKSDRLEMRNTGIEGHYVFIGHVRITGTNLEVTCDRVEVFSVSKDGDDQPKDSSVPDTGNIRRMLATGNVAISQEGRKATCGVAEVIPDEGKIILTESPIITDVATAVTMKGTRMTVFRDERYAVIENPEVVGPALPNLGFTPGGGTNGQPTTTPTPPATPPSTP